jgi:hypothetical protein
LGAGSIDKKSKIPSPAWARGDKFLQGFSWLIGLFSAAEPFDNFNAEEQNDAQSQADQ